MRNFLLAGFITAASLLGVSAQNNPVSPARTLDAQIDGVNVNISYYSPAVRDRQIWDGLVPYGKVWRTGANDATVITFSEAVKINGESIAAGSYAIFTIPNVDEWTLILNTESNQWGAYKYDQSKDALRVTLTPQMINEVVENMTFSQQDDQIVLSWEKLMLTFAISK